MRNRLICEQCHTAYFLPDKKAKDKLVCLDVMRVLTDPFQADNHVWFWSGNERTLYLNLSCKDALDMVFLRPGQSISSRGVIREMNVHVEWKCAKCGHIIEVDDKIPCLISEDTKIELEQGS